MTVTVTVSGNALRHPEGKGTAKPNPRSLSHAASQRRPNNFNSEAYNSLSVFTRILMLALQESQSRDDTVWSKCPTGRITSESFKSDRGARVNQKKNSLKFNEIFLKIHSMYGA